jgi:hypothetical protein
MRPYIICHMLSSVDGKIDGAALEAVTGNGRPAINLKSRVHRKTWVVHGLGSMLTHINSSGGLARRWMLFPTAQRKGVLQRRRCESAMVRHQGVAMDNGARKGLIPLENERNF